MPVAIVTGSSSGIGRGTALVFAKHGWQVSLSGRNEAALKEVVKECSAVSKKDAKNFTYTIGDVSDASVLESLVKNTLDKFGRIDSLVNNAGMAKFVPLATTPIDLFVKTFDVNVKSVLVLSQLALPHLIKSKGTIVNVSSIATQAVSEGAGVYAMSKAAVDQFTKTFALENSVHGVRVNAVNPGMVMTNLFSEGVRDMYAERAKHTHALGRAGTVDEIARGIYFLAGPESTFITGELLKIDGGLSLLRAPTARQ